MRTDDHLLFQGDDLVTLRPAAPRFPLGASFAGLIWLLVGGLGVATATVSLGSARPGAGDPLTGLVFAAWVTAAGYQTMAGQARDTRIHGALSILAGLAGVGMGWVIFTTPLKGLDLTRAHRLIAVGFYGGFGLVGFVLPGVLALVARRDYLAWREANSGRSGRRKSGAAGECRTCDYSPVATGARACPRCGADAPNPGGMGRYAGRGMLYGMAAGAAVAGLAKLVASGSLTDALALALLSTLPGLGIGLAAGLVLGVVWRPSR